MRGLLNDDDALPIYLRHSSELFSLEVAPERGIYIGIGYNGDSDEMPISTFLDGALARIRAERPAYVALDMRMNSGGHYTKTYTFAQALPEAANGAPDDS